MKNLTTNILSFFLIASFLFLSRVSFGQAWQKNYGGDIVFGNVEQTIDGGFVTTRHASSVVFKVDGAGNELWGYSTPAIYEDVFSHSLEVLTDGSIVAVGQASVSVPSYQQYLMIVKMDNGGNVIWEKFHPVSNGAVGPFLISSSPTGGFFIGGQYSFLLKVDDNGDQIWQNTLDGMRGLVATSDGGAAYLVNDNTTASDFLFVRKVDADGLQLWNKAFIGNDDLVGRQMTATADGGFAVTGFDYNGSASDYFILKMDSQGNQEFLQHFGPTAADAGQGIDQTQDGGYLITGWSNLAGRVTRLTRLDAMGNVLWERNYGAGEGLAVKEVANGNIIMAARGLRLFYLNADGSIFQNTITGNIFEDTNLDCVLQTGEPALEGWTVWANGPINNFGKTDAQGNFSIEVDTGSYLVEPSLPSFDWQPCNSQDQVVFNTAPASLAADDFLMQPNTPTTTTISGTVYQDQNGNCQLDPNEPLLANCLVNIGTESSSMDVPLFQITTDSNGFYSITVPTGEYYWVQLNALPPNCQACPDFPFQYLDAQPWTVDIGLDCQGGHLNGLVFFDENENCLLDAGESGIGGWTLAVTLQGTMDTTVYDAADFPTGVFSFFVNPGTYDLILTPPSSVLLSCQPIQTATVGASGSSPQVLFPLMPLSECPQLFVDIGTAGIRPCFNTDFYVQYCNWGTVTATDAYIEVALPAAFTFVSSDIPGNAQPGNIWSFPVGDVASGECQTFSLTAFLDCDEQVGLTYCTEAHAFPDTSCVDTSMFWDGSSVEVFANCDGDSVTLTIMNNGWGDMSQPLEFIVVEDNVLIRDSTFQLQSGNSTDLVVFPNGATILLQAQQSVGNPNLTNPIVVVEGCGGDSISIGFVTQYPQGDDDFYVDIDCRESVAAFDPNIKEAQPKGVTDAHFIQAETDLEYQITFQNLGTAPAVEVVILDTLSQYLDTATFRPGVASHDYSWELLNGHILKFTFENINLPQSNLDSINSIGFVKYHIDQINGNTPGTVIENRAGIYFDFNAPIITNTVMHQIPEPELFKTEIIYLCSGEMFNNETITENTVFHDTIRYAFFDSIFIQEINVLPVFETNMESEICEGEEFIFNGEMLVNTGVYTAELISQNGCDSLVILNLEVFPDLSETIDTAVIAGSKLFGSPVFSDTTIVQNMTDENGCFYTLTYNVETIVSTIDISSNIEINISPNPSNGNFTIQGKMPNAGKVSATLFNIYGQAVEDIFRDEYLNKNFTKKIIGDKIPAGTYYLIVKGDGWNTTQRVVIF